MKIVLSAFGDFFTSYFFFLRKTFLKAFQVFWNCWGSGEEYNWLDNIALFTSILILVLRNEGPGKIILVIFISNPITLPQAAAVSSAEISSNNITIITKFSTVLPVLKNFSLWEKNLNNCSINETL